MRSRATMRYTRKLQLFRLNTPDAQSTPKQALPMQQNFDFVFLKSFTTFLHL
jgi:hypothetical protein